MSSMTIEAPRPSSPARRLRSVWFALIAAGAIVAGSSTASASLNAGWNYQTAGQCVWVQSWISSPPNQVSISGTTMSAHGGCIGLPVFEPPAYDWGRPAGYIGVRPHLFRNGTVCTAPVWQHNPSYGATTHNWSFTWAPGVVPCGASAFFSTRTAGRVMDTTGVWRPTTSGTPAIHSGTQIW